MKRLAIDGGTAVFPEGPPGWPRPDEAVRRALEAAYADGSWGRYQGPHGEALRSALARMHGVRHAWLCSSGTIAVELALRGLKVGPGDEVILAAYDFPGNFRAIEVVGALPVLVDLAARSWSIDAGEVELAITPKTKSIIVSHLHGSLADMRRLRAIADERGLAIVEDACQVPGALIAGQPAGAWGDCGVLSFGGSKLLTAGRGGAIVTDREDVLQRVKIYAERGNDAVPLSELQAAVLLPQLPQLTGYNARRWQSANALIEACREIAGLVPLELPADAQTVPAFYKVPWLLTGNRDAGDSPEVERMRRKFTATVRAAGVALDEGFRGFASRSGGRCRRVGDLLNARAAAVGTVILHHPVLLEPLSTVERVADIVRAVAQQNLD